MAEWWESAPVVESTEADWWSEAPSVDEPSATPDQSWGDWVSDKFFGGLRNFSRSVGADAVSAVENTPAFLNRAGDTMTLGYIGDEASAAFDEMIGRGSYDDRLNVYRQQYDDLGAGGRFAADMAGSIVPALAGVGVMSSAPTLGGAVGRGALLGLGSGASTGFNQSEGGFGNRLLGGVVGGVLGGAIGGAVPIVGDMARRGVRGVSDWSRNSAIGNAVGDALGVNPQTAQVLTNVMEGQDANSVAAALMRSGDDAMLADVPALTGVLDASMRSPTQGAATAAQRIGDRAASSGDEIIDVLRSNRPGPYQGVVSTERAVNANNRALVNPLYERAYNTPIDYSSPQGKAIEELVTRVPPKQLRRAIERATDEMIYDGIPNAQILAEVAEDGAVRLKQLPNVMQLDYIKRAFDEIAEDGTDPLTRQMTSEGRFASRVARDIRDATKAAVPEYDEALKQAATGIRQRGAVKEGSRLLDQNISVETASEIIGGATEAEKRLMREGLIAQIEHRLGNIKAVGSDQNVDAREAAKAWSELSSANTQRKLESLFGSEWPAVKETLDRAGAAVGLRANTAANSATAQRQYTNQMIDEITQPGALASGQPVQAARNFMGGVLGTSPDAVAGVRNEIRSELADILTRQGGTAQTAQRAIAEVLMANPRNVNAGRFPEQVVRALGLMGLPQITGAVNEVMLDPIYLEGR